jgi:hypothetical protein
MRKRTEPTPCPFCGVKPTVEHWHGGGKDNTRVGCEQLRCASNPSVVECTRPRAIKAWNNSDHATRLAAVIACVPTNWVDDLLTGKSSPFNRRGPGNWGCPEVEWLLNNIRTRMHEVAKCQ